MELPYPDPLHPEAVGPGDLETQVKISMTIRPLWQRQDNKIPVQPTGAPSTVTANNSTEPLGAPEETYIMNIGRKKKRKKEILRENTPSSWGAAAQDTAAETPPDA